MNRRIAVGGCLLGMSVLGLLTPTLATATEPAFYECAKVKGGSFEDKQCTREAGTVKGEKYELEEGIRKGKIFKGKGGEVRLYAPAINAPVPCTGSKDEGKLASPTTVEHLVLIFTGCSTMFRPCTSTGAKRGEVRTETLDGRLGEIAPGSPGLLASAHTAKGAASIAAMSCEGLSIEVSGSIVGELSGDVNALSKTFTLSYAEAEDGEPAITQFEGGDPQVLESVFNGSGPFSSSLRGTITNKTEELEIKA